MRATAPRAPPRCALLCAVVGRAAAAGGGARAYIGTLRLNVSDTSPHTDSVLPFFHWMNVGNEGGTGFGVQPVDMSPRPGIASMNDALPDYLLQNTLADQTDRMLPWRVKDGWTGERTPQDVRVAVLENEYLRVDVTPLWGGKIHRAMDKRTGRHLVHFSPWHQCVNDGVLRCMEASGVQWNWMPNEIGHAVSTNNPVYVARLATERGDALRIWEYDRWNGTVWQVDLHLAGDALWAHVRIINPSPVDIAGYWWTNVEMPMTSATFKGADEVMGQRCKPSDPSWPGSRVISPAWGALTTGGHGQFELARWPRFTENCCGEDGDQNVPGSLNGRGALRGPTDMSWLSNYTASDDAFLQCLGWNRTAAPFIVLADRDLWAEQSGVLHGHGTPFNKLWVFGNDQANGWAQSRRNWGACFAELQIGAAPSQLHTFPLAAGSSHHHSEYWKLMDGLEAPGRLYADDYGDAVDAAVDYVNGPRGVPPAAWRDMDAWAREVSGRALAADDVLFNASAWGALDAALTGRAPPRSVRFFADPRAEFAAEDTAPWAELLRDGRFSAATLRREPRSFVAGGGAPWLAAIHAAAARHGWDWLLHYHAGCDAAERRDIPRARAHFNASAALRATASALRALAVTAPAAAERRALYARAWAAAAAVPADDPAAARLRAGLAGEVAFVLGREASAAATPPADAAQAWDALEQRLREFRALGVAQGTTAAGDAVATAAARLAIARGRPGDALSALAAHPFLHSHHGLRPELLGLWLSAQLAKEEDAKGRPLTAVERKRVKYDPARAPPRTLGAWNRPSYEGPPGVAWP